jgi:hypothetical protein
MMATPEDTGRITVSRDALRADLAELELRLVDRLATKSEVEDLRRDVERLQRWRSYITGMASTALALAGACSALVVYALTH